jgi:flagellar biosynthesis protein FlhG
VAAFASDQAEGLRRLLSSDFVRVVTVASGRPRIGKTTTVLNLAAALARRGRKVLIFDEQPRRPQLEHALTPAPRHDLLAVVHKKKAIEECVVAGPPGVHLLPAHEAMRALPNSTAAQQETLAAAFRKLAQSVDVLLVDPSPGTSDASVSLALAAQELLLLTTRDATAITDAYALIKRLARNFAHRRFHVVVNKTRGGEDAEAIYNNIAQTAGHYLDVRLAYLGHVPADDQARQAAKLGQAVVDAYPASPSSLAFRALAERIDLWPYPTDDTGRIETFLNKLLITSRLTAEDAHL